MEGPGNIYRLEIDAFSPKTIPMAKLAAYMDDLAQLLGDLESVHFVGLEPGSAVVVSEVDASAAARVLRRAYEVQAAVADGTAPNAASRLIERLEDDGARGTLRGPHGQALVEFSRPRKPQRNGPLDDIDLDGTVVTENDTEITGELIRIGGQSELVPVHILEVPKKKPRICQANRELARDLAAYFFGPTIRVHGEGTWRFKKGEGWILERLIIDSFEVLEESSLSDVIARVREIDSPLKHMKDPVSVLNRIRYGEE